MGCISLSKSSSLLPHIPAKMSARVLNLHHVVAAFRALKWKLDTGKNYSYPSRATLRRRQVPPTQRPASLLLPLASSRLTVCLTSSWSASSSARWVRTSRALRSSALLSTTNGVCKAHSPRISCSSAPVVHDAAKSVVSDLRGTSDDTHATFDTEAELDAAILAAQSGTADHIYGLRCRGCGRYSIVGSARETWYVVFRGIDIGVFQGM